MAQIDIADAHMPRLQRLSQLYEIQQFPLTTFHSLPSIAIERSVNVLIFHFDLLWLES